MWEWRSTGLSNVSWSRDIVISLAEAGGTPGRPESDIGPVRDDNGEAVTGSAYGVGRHAVATGQ
jgi:hypothetical protein